MYLHQSSMCYFESLSFGTLVILKFLPRTSALIPRLMLAILCQEPRQKRQSLFFVVGYSWLQGKTDQGNGVCQGWGLVIEERK